MIRVENLAIRAGDFALTDVSFTIPSGRYGVLMGKTGSGKTMLLEAICGLKRVLAGSIVLSGRDVTHLKPAERGIGFVPQDGALFSTMSVRDHIAFSMVIRKWTRAAIDSRVDELVELLDLQHLLGRRPQGLSGGERQRVALGRALASRPTVLCLDEPLSALDDETREEMYVLLRSVREQTGVTALHITHSTREAEALADKLILLEEGSVIDAQGEERPPETDARKKRNQEVSE